ncbi:MAG: glutamate synthase large subunit [Myxococcota bacterium]
MRPKAHGLYDPSMEHEACGIAFVAQLEGEKSKQVVDDALEALERLSHRGACGSDPETGDGAGILVQLPHRFFKRKGQELGFDMPRRRRYGIGQVFLPPDEKARRACEEIVEQIIEQEGQRTLGWRPVPVDETKAGPMAREVMPAISQVFVARRRVVPSEFERKLYVIRKRVEVEVRTRGVDPEGFFHFASMSAETIVYKGLLRPDQLRVFYRDLAEEDFVSAIAMVHSRFSTNTFPTWDLAQPFNRICHNGEINTVRGNCNWLDARRSMLQSAKFGGDLERLGPIIKPDASDSAKFDNMVELLHLGGRELPHAMMMMIPEAWQGDELMDPDRRAFYDYASSLVEPWDGPAAIVFSDGRIVGATLDRNGLRPARFVVTDDKRVILASETGALDIDPQRILRNGRLQPGRMLIVDTDEGRIVGDDEVKSDITGRFPYARWLKKNQYQISDLPPAPAPPRLTRDELTQLQAAFGYTDEDLRIILEPMSRNGKEPTGSMGTDTPLAVLSDRAPLLFNYFKQLFAQVTNPPIDPIRESLVMSVETCIGRGANTFDETPEQCHGIKIPSPVMTAPDLAIIKAIYEGVFETATLSILYDANGGPDALSEAVDKLCAAAGEAIDEGFNILVLSDRGVDADRAAIPSLLAVSAVHHHLVREGIRLRTGLVVETAEAREVHHFALLLGYGAAAVNPYLALATVRHMAMADGGSKEDGDAAVRNYIAAVDKGLLKIMSKMGISTLGSYTGAQIFEALGVSRELTERHFTGTPSRIGGVGLRELGDEVLARHARAYGPDAHYTDPLPIGGVYQWRRRGEQHAWNPGTIAKLQASVRQNDAELFAEFSRLANDETRRHMTIRGLLDFDTAANGAPIDLDEVEAAEEIVKRFCTGAMSFGSISAPAHESLAIAMNRLGGRSNSGEGGEEQRRFKPQANGDSRNSAIKQVASGRFGVHIEYLRSANELQIKVAQGAKPGEGGQLPGHKVSERIADVRCSTPGVTLISPPPHHDIYSIEDLAQLIYDLKVANPGARVSVKLVSEMGVGTIAAGVSKARAEAIVIAGDGGGTGASPLSSVRHAGTPWELGLAETQQVLVQNDLRSRVRLQVDGGFRTARDVVIGGLLGAEEFGFSTAPLVAMGCIMLRKCHLNTCSVGIATQDPELVRRFAGEPLQVVRYFFFIAHEVRRMMAHLGFRRFDDLVGRVDKLKRRDDLESAKAKTVDIDAILAQPQAPATVQRRHHIQQNFELEGHLDRELIRACSGAIEHERPIRLTRTIGNTDRTVGAMLSGEIASTRGIEGLPDETVMVYFRGSAGQSFGAFLAKGVTFALEGDANDYVAKGLSGGRLAIFPPTAARFPAHENIIIGNVVLYGATGGELYAAGMAGERFAVRNSGAKAVVEGVGDHGCEYMTGGVVVVLGPTGRNFAAGMSGGYAFVLDSEGTFRKRCNFEMVRLEGVIDEADITLLRTMIEAHVEHTGSDHGRKVLDNWDISLTRFVKVMPVEYARVLAERAARAKQPAKLAIVEGGI